MSLEFESAPTDGEVRHRPALVAAAGSKSFPDVVLSQGVRREMAGREPSSAPLAGAPGAAHRSRT